MAQLGGVAKIAAEARLRIFVGEVTTDGPGNATIAHGLQGTPKVAFAFSNNGGAFNAIAVTADGVNVTIAGGEASQPHTVVAFG